MHFFFEFLTSVVNKTAVSNLITGVAGFSGTQVRLSEYVASGVISQEMDTFINIFYSNKFKY